MWMLDVVSDLIGYGGSQENLGCLFLMVRKYSRADVNVGRRIQSGRGAAGVTAMELCAVLEISAAELQRYETGEFRIPPDRLLLLAKKLRLPISYFFSHPP